MRIGQALCGLLMASVCAISIGCADQPKPGGVKTVSPAIPAKGDEKPADKGEEKPKPPADAGSTTGGGTETPAAPKDGQ